MEEVLLVIGKLFHDGPRGHVGVQHLVGGEEPEAIDEVGVVEVVEGDGADGVHVDGDGRGDVGRARLLELGRVVRVVGRVSGRAAGVAVEPVGEEGAVREADGVRAGERHQVGRRQVVLLEHGGELPDVHVLVGQLALDVAGLGDEAVKPAELDAPVGAGRLRAIISMSGVIRNRNRVHSHKKVVRPAVLCLPGRRRLWRRAR
jgi:hypothetical protein